MGVQATLKEKNRALAATCELQRLVYDCMEVSDHTETGHFAPYYQRRSHQDLTLVFESRFESGNLRRAVQVPYLAQLVFLGCPVLTGSQVAPYTYDLYLKTDFNTNKHTQWCTPAVSLVGL